MRILFSVIRRFFALFNGKPRKYWVFHWLRHLLISSSKSVQNYFIQFQILKIIVINSQFRQRISIFFSILITFEQFFSYFKWRSNLHEYPIDWIGRIDLNKLGCVCVIKCVINKCPLCWRPIKRLWLMIDSDVNKCKKNLLQQTNKQTNSEQKADENFRQRIVFVVVVVVTARHASIKSTK